MAKSRGFAFDKAATADERMAALESFITHWLGPRKAEHGVPEADLDAVTLPAPLRRLYAFAGRWERPHNATTENVPIFSVSDGLRAPEALETTDDGKLVFLDENQGNWHCATLPDGEDPPVWFDDPFNPNPKDPWSLVSPSLSQFLVTFAIRELLMNSDPLLQDKNLEEWFASLQGENAPVPLWTGPYPNWDEPCSFSLVKGTVLVGELGGIWFGAKDAKGAALLEKHQGTIRQVGLALEGSWSLAFLPDGSASINMPGRFDAEALAPPGTFDFAAVRDVLLAAADDTLPRRNPWYVYFPRQGQTSSFGQGVKDPALAASLLRRLLGSIKTREANFDDLLAEFPPP